MGNPSAHRAKRRFGQNFLVDRNVIDRIVASIDPAPCDHIVEIGPGLGALTRPLLAKLDRLDVVELDRDVIPKLEQMNNADHLHIHNTDVLDFDFTQFSRANFEGEKLRIIGNLPYNISTAVLFHLIKHINVIEDLHFMLQKEVVERIDARTGAHDYGRLSVMMQLHFKVKPLFTVAPQCFRPVPKVESAVLSLTPVGELPITPEQQADFSALIKQAFSQRRKTLKNTLRGLFDASQLKAAGIDPGKRAQELSISEFIKLFRQGRKPSERLSS